MVQIAVINESTVIDDAAVQAMMLALQTQWNRDLAPIWDLEAAFFSFVPKGSTPTAGSWWLVFLDDSDQAGALAYHDLTNEGLPISKVFCKTILSDNSSISVGASHELCEMAVDPTINLGAQDNAGEFWAYETCDPCEDDQYGYKIGDILVTDFITPAWFGFANSAGKPLDFTGHISKPFQVLSGGYAQHFDSTNGWVQITGAKARTMAKALIVGGSRRERRTRGAGQFQVSVHKF
jgi:hypothetical protein